MAGLNGGIEPVHHSAIGIGGPAGNGGMILVMDPVEPDRDTGRRLAAAQI